MNHNSEKNKEAISRKEIISFLVILIITVLVLIALPRIRQFHNHHIAEQEKQKMQPVIQSVENIILPIAQEHGITDLTVSFIDKPYSVKVYCKSDSFSSLSDMKKLLFLVAVSEKVHDEGIKFPEESEYRYENSFHLAIRSGDYEYVDTVISGKSKLQRKYAPSTDVPSAVGGYDTIFEMETAYARSISTSNTHNSSSSEKCYWCNGTGSVRYNYGSSDLEAILSGHDPYTYGTCASCGGTGKAK